MSSLLSETPKKKKYQQDVGVMESFLDKRGHNVKNWKRRYFVLNENRKVISYFLTSEKKKKKGSLKILKVFNLPDRPDQPNKRQNRLDFHGVDLSSRAEISICVAAESAALKQRWLDAVHTGIAVKAVKRSRGSMYRTGQAEDLQTPTGSELVSIPDDEFDSISFEGLGGSSDNQSTDFLFEQSNTKVDLDKAENNLSGGKAVQMLGVSNLEELDDKPTKEGYLSIKTNLSHGITSAWNDFYFIFDGISRLVTLLSYYPN